MKNKRNGFMNVIYYGTFTFYILILFFILLRGFMPMRAYRMMNLIPFRTVLEYINSEIYMRGFAIQNILGNIVLFVPLGIYISVFMKGKNTLAKTLYICLISFIVEVIQYIFMLGSADIDDIILNTFGGFLGISIYKLIFKITEDDYKTKHAVSFLSVLGAVFTLVYLALNKY